MELYLKSFLLSATAVYFASWLFRLPIDLVVRSTIKEMYPGLRSSELNEAQDMEVEKAVYFKTNSEFYKFFDMAYLTLQLPGILFNIIITNGKTDEFQSWSVTWATIIVYWGIIYLLLPNS